MTDASSKTPIIIRNQRYEPWLARLARIGVVIVVGICLCVLCAGSSPQGAVLSVVFTVLTIPLWDRVAVRVPMLRQVERLKLADTIEFYPRTIPAAGGRATAIAFSPDPGEDYAEDARPVGLCEARLSLESFGPFRLIVSIHDARRLRKWAEERQVAVTDSNRLLDEPWGGARMETVAKPGVERDRED
jgi:hypothetical protein